MCKCSKPKGRKRAKAKPPITDNSQESVESSVNEQKPLEHEVLYQTK